MNEYVKQGQDFLKKNKIRMTYVFLGKRKHFIGDEQERNVYEITFERSSKLKRATKEYKWNGFKVKFGTSLVDTENHKRPNAYDVLACLTKYDPGNFEDFCADFGYSDDSIKALKTYKLVMAEWGNVRSFFTDKELEELVEIN